jgi:hypothetical protein
MNGDGVPEEWDIILKELNEKTSDAVEGLYIFDDRLLEKWIELCSRMILGYSKNLIKQAVIAGLFVFENGKEEIEKQIGKSYEWFSWGINRIFYKEVLPRAGVVELADVMDLGSYGMLSDQDTSPSVSQKSGECVIKKSFLLTCQLYGIYSSVEKWMGLKNGDLTPAYCPFCIGHGEKTMFFVVPPDMKLSYKLTEGLGYGGKLCEFTLRMEPAEDYERADNAQMIIFGDDDIEV